MPYHWPEDTKFDRLILEVEDKSCTKCGRTTTVCDHRHRHIHTFDGPVKMTMKLTHCPDESCAKHSKTISPEAEIGISPPYWAIGWDIFAWIGQRRFSRHWSVPQIVDELMDTYGIRLAARRQDPGRLKEAYEGIDDLVLSIDGLQPEKGHETLYVIRELRARRVWITAAQSNIPCRATHDGCSEEGAWISAGEHGPWPGHTEPCTCLPIGELHRQGLLGYGRHLQANPPTS